MKYRLLGWLLLLPLLLMAQERPKVAVVLSGGGAKGTAHIGALKVIEKAGIPIDYVVGTSMGAIVGGLYAIGYTPEQLDSMVNTQNWKFVLSDAPNPKDVLLDDRLRSERYVLSIPFTLKSADISDAGIIKGKNIAQLFSVLTEGYQDSVNFSRLPIPFACLRKSGGWERGCVSQRCVGYGHALQYVDTRSICTCQSEWQGLGRWRYGE